MIPRRIIPLIPALILAYTAVAPAQLTPDEFTQLNTAIGQRVETAVVLGTANSITTGGYKWSLDQADGTITRATWEFNLGDKELIDDTGLKYVWNCDGGVGYASYHDLFLTGALEGNSEKFESYAVGSNIGPRIYLTDEISVLPEIGLIYGYTINNFDGPTPVGRSLILDSLVNWHVQTLSVTPSIQGQYERTFFRCLKLQARSTYSYFTTFPIERSTGLYDFSSESEVWQNSLDLDYNTGLRLLDFPLHLGGTISRTDLFDGIQAAMDVSHYYNVAGRIYFDTKPNFWFVGKLGMAASYTWGNGFHGYALGVVFDVAF